MAHGLGSSRLRLVSWRLIIGLVVGFTVAILLLGLGYDTVLGARHHLVIVHQNDFHGRLESVTDGGKSAGGLARIAALVEEIRRQYPGSVLWLDGGDTWHGTPLANLFDGFPVVEAFNEAGLDAMVLGNHDFNFGQAALAARVAQASFPVLSANTVRADENELLVLPSAVFSVGGLRVAVLGLTTPLTVFTTHADNVAGLDFLDPFEVASAVVPRLREEAALVIALTHLGYEQDCELAARVPGIDVIVGGHSHTALPEAVAVGDTLIVQAGDHGRYVGVLELTVEDGRVVDYDSKLIPVTDALPPHPRVQSVIEAWVARVPEQLEMEIAYTEVDLGGEERQVRVRETALANLIADSMRHATGADVALLNGGAVRGFIPAGPIRLGDLATVLPFGGTLVGVYLTGAQLVDVLEHGVSGYPLEWGGFLQVSGLTYAFDPERPAGERLWDVRVGNEPIEFSRTYKVVVNDFMAAGGDGYVMLRQAPVWLGSDREDGLGVRDALVDYLRRVGLVAPRVEGRIRIAAGESRLMQPKPVAETSQK